MEAAIFMRRKGQEIQQLLLFRQCGTFGGLPVYISNLQHYEVCGYALTPLNSSGSCSFAQQRNFMVLS